MKRIHWQFSIPSNVSLYPRLLLPSQPITCICRNCCETKLQLAIRIQLGKIPRNSIHTIRPRCIYSIPISMFSKQGWIYLKYIAKFRLFFPLQKPRDGGESYGPPPHGRTPPPHGRPAQHEPQHEPKRTSGYGSPWQVQLRQGFWGPPGNDLEPGENRGPHATLHVRRCGHGHGTPRCDVRVTSGQWRDIRFRYARRSDWRTDVGQWLQCIVVCQVTN